MNPKRIKPIIFLSTILTSLVTGISVFASEIDAVLEYLKIPKNTTTSEWLGNMTMAQCIFLDTFGRKERITVDGMFPEITQLFDTVETKLKAI